jgi:hypothetical protein
VNLLWLKAHGPPVAGMLYIRSHEASSLSNHIIANKSPHYEPTTFVLRAR